MLTGDEKFIFTTGRIARELFLEHGSSKNFYLVGSMGCAAPIALGYSLSHPEKPVIVLDGDGAALMKLGALATIGHYGLGNLIHIILDNNAYESTGGQHSISDTVDFVGVAKAIGYKNAVKVWNRNQIINAVKASRVSYGPSMIVIRVSNTSLDNLPRIKYSCEEITERFEG